jgi:hypothetical protein
MAADRAGTSESLLMVLAFWLRSVEIFRSVPSGKLVSQTSRLAIGPAHPTVEAQGAHPQRSRQTTPLHSTSNAGSVPERWLARVLLVCPFAALVWLGSSLSWFDHTQPCDRQEQDGYAERKESVSEIFIF